MNTEVRAYHFVASLESEQDANATISETAESRRTRFEGKKREGPAPAPTSMQQKLPVVASEAVLDKRGIHGEWKYSLSLQIHPNR